MTAQRTPPPTPEQREILLALATKVLNALASVSDAARATQHNARPVDVRNVLAVTINTMANRRQPGEVAFAQGAARTLEQLKRLVSEPFVARVEVEWSHQSRKRETLYVCRGVPGALDESPQDGRLINYLTPLGRIAELPAGDEFRLQTPGGVRLGLLEQKVRLHPFVRDGQWDGKGESIDFEDWSISVESIRQLAAQLPTLADLPDVVDALLQEIAEEATVRITQKKQIVDRISLRDQPILDQFQGEVFRMPLDGRLLLLGPPGTGKTTTLIRRLAQKRTPEALTEQEIESLDRAGIKNGFLDAHSWVMFTPTELLKLYLKEAFGREHVPASDEHIKTWEKERLNLGRNVFHILRSASTGRFQLDAGELLRDPSSEGVRRLLFDFGAAAENAVLSRVLAAVTALRGRGEAELNSRLERVVGRRATEGLLSRETLAAILERGAELQEYSRKLEDGIELETKGLVSLLLRKHPSVLDELADQLSSIVGDAGDQQDDGDLEDDEASTQAIQASDNPQVRRRLALQILMNSIRVYSRAIALGRPRVSGQARRILEILGHRMPSREDLKPLGESLLSRARIRTILQSPRSFVMGLPSAYAQFRASELGRGYYADDAETAIRQGKISPSELDLLILQSLRNARSLTEIAGWTTSVGTADWLDRIREQYVMQVSVDEATDFSSIQLACTMELANPRLCSWFACGDFDQRITAYGLRDESEVAWLSEFVKPIEVRRVDIPYRQSESLAALAADLAGSPRIVTQTAVATILPVLSEGLVGAALGNWLAQRIIEIEKAIGHLPSIAVLVDGDEQVDLVVAATRDALQAANINIVGCKEGRVIGDEMEVRVFDVRHIKGLEFEAVFFVGVDRLAQRLPDLFERFLYVGVSRAATYLGLTCDTALPASIARVRGHFASGGWA